MPILYLYVPDHWCRAPKVFQNTTLSDEEIIELTIPYEENGKRSQCQMYEVDFVWVLSIDGFAPKKDWPTQKCQYGYNYNLTGLFTSIVTDVCEFYRRRSI